MEWTLGDPVRYQLLFWGVGLFGVGIGACAYLLVGRPFAKAGSDPKRPVIGALCGFLFMLPFWLLGHQMTGGRFVHARLDGETLTLGMARGKDVVLKRSDLAQVKVTQVPGAEYLLISSVEQSVFRAGPVKPNAQEAYQAILAWSKP